MWVHHYVHADPVGGLSVYPPDTPDYSRSSLHLYDHCRASCYFLSFYCPGLDNKLTSTLMERMFAQQSVKKLSDFLIDGGWLAFLNFGNILVNLLRCRVLGMIMCVCVYVVEV